MFNMRDRAKWDAWKAVEGSKLHGSKSVIPQSFLVIMVRSKMQLDDDHKLNE